MKLGILKFSQNLQNVWKILREPEKKSNDTIFHKQSPETLKMFRTLIENTCNLWEHTNFNVVEECEKIPTKKTEVWWNKKRYKTNMPPFHVVHKMPRPFGSFAWVNLE